MRTGNGTGCRIGNHPGAFPGLDERDPVTTYSPQDDSSSPTPLYDQTGFVAPLLEEGLSSTDTTTDDTSGKADAAKEQAGKVAGDAQDATKHVAGVTKDQAGQVASEVKSQAKDLFQQTTTELKDQAGTQQQKVADGLRSVSDELSSMAGSADGGGVATELVRNLSGRAGSVASWLDGRDPGSLLTEVKSFAARKPGTFIAIAAGAGILAGRLAKSLAAEAKNDAPSTGSSSEAAPSLDAPQTYATPAYAAPTVAPTQTTADDLFAEAVGSDPIEGINRSGDPR